jgi:hypothetical protein
MADTAGMLTATVSELVVADTNGLRPSIGFMVDQDGTLRCRLVGDASTVDLPLKGSVPYPLDLAQVVFTAGTVNITKVWIFRQGGKVSRT